jgi:hypothetical protein
MSYPERHATAGAVGPHEPVEEGDELLVGVLRVAGAGDLPRGDLQGGVEAGGAVALVVVGHPGCLARLDRQRRLGAIQRLPDLRESPAYPQTSRLLLISRDFVGVSNRGPLHFVGWLMRLVQPCPKCIPVGW